MRPVTSADSSFNKRNSVSNLCVASLRKYKSICLSLFFASVRFVTIPCMPDVTIYHNPRCTKSRQTLALLESHGIQPKVVEYLKTPPDEQTLRDLIKKLGIEPQDLLRQKEYHKLQLPETDDPDKLISQMAANPQIIERPLVVCGRRARIGRPPENVLEIVDVASS